MNTQCDLQVLLDPHIIAACELRELGPPLISSEYSSQQSTECQQQWATSTQHLYGVPTHHTDQFYPVYDYDIVTASITRQVEKKTSAAVRYSEKQHISRISS